MTAATPTSQGPRAQRTSSTDEGGSRHGRLPHFPAIEGLRGLAVAGVVLFHARFDWMKGGYLGVSTFFTLSGFLITALLLAERGASGGVDLRRFWTRRVRRLMPASFAALALILVFGVVAADAVQRRNLGGDVTAALAYVANWRFLFSNQSYGELFAAPSPVLHFWSLAIEEQFYLVFPVLAWFGLARLRLRQGVFAVVLAVLIGASLVLTLAGGLSHDAIYYNTFTRAAELLAGALLAALVYRRRVTTAIATHPTVRWVVAGAGAIALLVMLVLWVTVPQDADWLYRGGFVAYSGLSALVIVAAIAPYGPVQRLLANRPLCALGAISYGVYLFHWPIFVWLDPARTGWSDAALFIPRVAIAIAIALVSYHFLEQPIRRGRRLVSVRPAVLAPAIATTLAVAAIAITINAPKPTIDFESAEAKLAAAGSDAPPATGPVATVPEPPAPRMAIFGDSTALMTGGGLQQWAQTSGKADFVAGSAVLGCGVGRGGERRDMGFDGKLAEGPVDPICNQWATSWYEKITTNEPNIAVVQVGPWEVADRKLPGDTVWRALGDPVYDRYLEGEMDAAVQTLSKDGALVIWLTSPMVGPDEHGRDAITAHGPGGEPARMLRLNQLIRALPQRNPGLVQVVDLDGWLAASGDDRRLRADGVHFDGPSATEVSDRWLGDAIVKAYRDGWAQRVAARTAPTPPLTTASAPPTTGAVTGAPSTTVATAAGRR